MQVSELPVRGILFDKDGTLLDYHATFMPLNWQVVRELARGDEALARELMILSGWDPETDRIKPGTPFAAWTLKEIADFVHPHIDIEDSAEVLDIINRVFDAGPERAIPVTDLKVFLGELKSLGLMLGISTSDHTSAAKETVTHLGLNDVMDFVAGYDAGHGPKPTPGIINAFCAQHGFSPAEVMVVGDNHHDIDFARNGGAGWAVGVLTGNSYREDLEPIADIVLDDITGIPAYLATIAAARSAETEP